MLVVDTAHGHAQGVLDRVKWVKQTFPKAQVIGGNIATADCGARHCVDHGADGVKVGIGPGSICTTRIVAGVGVPHISAVQNVAQRRSKRPDIPLIADGGIRFSGDIAKALAAGAHSVMIGGLFAGTEEAPGEIELYQGRSLQIVSRHGFARRHAAGFERSLFSGRRRIDRQACARRRGRPRALRRRGRRRSSSSSWVDCVRAMGYVGCADIDADARAKRSSSKSPRPVCANRMCTTCRSRRKHRTIAWSKGNVKVKHCELSMCWSATGSRVGPLSLVGNAHQRILILDFGAQYTQLIARRVRECSVYCETPPFRRHDTFVRNFAPSRRDSLGRTGIGVGRRCATRAASGIRAWRSGAGNLLRHADYGRATRRKSRERRRSRVRIRRSPRPRSFRTAQRNK